MNLHINNIERSGNVWLQYDGSFAVLKYIKKFYLKTSAALSLPRHRRFSTWLSVTLCYWIVSDDQRNSWEEYWNPADTKGWTVCDISPSRQACEWTLCSATLHRLNQTDREKATLSDSREDRYCWMLRLQFMLRLRDILPSHAETSPR